MDADVNYEVTAGAEKEAEKETIRVEEKKDDTTMIIDAKADTPGRGSEKSVSFKTDNGVDIEGSPRGSVPDLDSSYVNAHRDSMSEHDADDEGDEFGSDHESNTEEHEESHYDYNENDDDGSGSGKNELAVNAKNDFSDSGSDASKSSENKTERDSKNKRPRNKKRIQFKTIREQEKDRDDDEDKVKDNDKEEEKQIKVDENKDENRVAKISDEDEDENKEKTRQPKIVDRSPTKRYVRFNEMLGEGSFKKVYLAYDSQQGVEVAWNTVKIGNVKNDVMQRTLQEMKLLQTMNHPHIIKFYASWLNKETQSVVFVTEMMSSGTLKEFIRNRPVRLRIVKRWSRHILHALHYMHVEMNPPIIHRDLKCDNIFINGATGDIRIGDMGLASWQRNGNAKSVLGTPEYMAPEMFNEKYDCKVDIYAFGMCVLEMITKETPYMECSSTPQIYKKVMGNILPESFSSVIDSPIKSFIYLCIKKPGPEESRPSAAELRANPFLKKMENDPNDDIDCEEFIDKSSETRKSRMERKLSTTSITGSQSNADVNTDAAEKVAAPEMNMPARAKTPSPTPQPVDEPDTEISEKESLAENKDGKKPNLNTAVANTTTTTGAVNVLQDMSDVEQINHNATENMSPKSPGSSLSDVLHRQMESQSVQAEEVAKEESDNSKNRLQKHDTNNSNESTSNKDGTVQSVEVDMIKKLVPKGTIIEARFGGDNAWFPGKIERVNSNGLFDIKYEDQDYEAGVSAELITLINSSGDRVPLKPLIDQYLGKHKPATMPSNAEQSTTEETVSSKPPLPRRHTAAIPTTNAAPVTHTRWKMVAKNPGGAGVHLNELTIVFQSNGGVSAMFPFNLENDQASAVAAELVETLKLSRTELDSIALNLLQFRQEYEEFRAGNPTKPFSRTVERDTQTRVSLSDSSAFVKRSPSEQQLQQQQQQPDNISVVASDSSSASSPESTQWPPEIDNKDTAMQQLNVSDVAEDKNSGNVTPREQIDPTMLASRPTEEEVAEYDRQIQLEQEEYRRIQAEHLERVEALKQQKEQARAQRILLKAKAQSEVDVIEATIPTGPIPGHSPATGCFPGEEDASTPERSPSISSAPPLERSTSISSAPSQGTAASVPALDSISLTKQVAKTKEELREEAKAKIEVERAIEKEKLKAESAQLEQKIAGLDTFSLHEGENTEEKKAILPPGPSATTHVIPPKPTPEMTLNEKRQKDQLQAKMILLPITGHQPIVQPGVEVPPISVGVIVSQQNMQSFPVQQQNIPIQQQNTQPLQHQSLPLQQQQNLPIQQQSMQSLHQQNLQPM
uniref:non-specific serine/threonine protein kinase n=1 Tax=Aplanochytrium stocchinoi TaxID=215587 RepID=A0A7S3PM32_9STRA